MPTTQRMPPVSTCDLGKPLNAHTTNTTPLSINGGCGDVAYLSRGLIANVFAVFSIGFTTKQLPITDQIQAAPQTKHGLTFERSYHGLGKTTSSRLYLGFRSPEHNEMWLVDVTWPNHNCC